MTSGPHHTPTNRALLEDTNARVASLERYVTALIADRAAQRKLIDHVLRLVAQKEALLSAIGRQALDAKPETPTLREEVPKPC